MTLAKTPPSFDLSQTVTVAKAALDIEANALRQAADRLDGGFTAVVARILACTGRVVVMGMGKSGHVGNKIAATLASTGTPAFFVHPGEASHGDLGMITADDLVLAVSNSGDVIKRMGIGLIALTGGADSSLARYADGVLNSAVDKEACPLNLAPTASTTVQMALGDALAIALLDARGFKPADFARSHPGGALGRKLLTHVHDIMRTEGQIPSVTPEATGLEVMREMSDKGLGATAIVNSQNQPVGIFTDGDLRRLLEGGGDLRAMTAATLMRNAPRVISMDALAAEAADVMEANAVTSLLVVDGDGRLVGALNANDLMRAKVI